MVRGTALGPSFTGESEFGDSDSEGPYVEGKRHGKWVLRTRDGRVGGGAYVDGRKQGSGSILSQVDNGKALASMTSGTGNGSFVNLDGDHQYKRNLCERPFSGRTVIERDCADGQNDWITDVVLRLPVPGTADRRGGSNHSLPFQDRSLIKGENPCGKLSGVFSLSSYWDSSRLHLPNCRQRSW